MRITSNAFLILALSFSICNSASSQFICDTLSRSFPFGDCDFGHTMDDDVEWPDDISISDYRIEPDELILYSNIDILDAYPSFSNMSNFQSIHSDTIIVFSEMELSIQRTWHVSHDDTPDSSWTYNQIIQIDSSNYSQLVMVNTHTGRPVPDVTLSNNIQTNKLGFAIIGNDTSAIEPSRIDKTENGLNILDTELSYRHILGVDTLSDLALIAADANFSHNVSVIDVITQMDLIIRPDFLPFGGPWFFYEHPDTLLPNIKMHYLANKTGDVDDSVVFYGKPEYNRDIEFGFDDMELSNNVSYDIPIYAGASNDCRNAQFILNYDSTLIKINDITTTKFNGESEWSNHNQKIAMISRPLPPWDIDQLENSSQDPIFTLNITAKQDALLSWSLSFSEDQNSFILDDDLELILVNPTINNVIVSHADNSLIEEKQTLVFPSPANHSLFMLDYERHIDSNGTVYIYDLLGNLVLYEQVKEEINISSLNQGHYVLVLASDDGNYSQKMQVIR